jgi:hypothetical protein
MNALAPYMKAVLAFITPAAVTIVASITEASDGGSTITGSEWITALCNCVITATAVYAVPNRPAAHRATPAANPKI